MPNSVSRPIKPAAKRRVSLAVYLEPAIARQLKARADSDRRSASTQAGLFIEEGLGLRPRSDGRVLVSTS